MYRITIKLLKYAYVSSYVGYTYIILFTSISNRIQKRKPIICRILSAVISTSIVTFGYANMYTTHQTTYNLKTEKNITPTKICFISDVHYPNANNPERLKKSQIHY